MNLQQILDELDGSLPDLPFVRRGGSFLLMAGLPGSGKSLIVEKVQARNSSRRRNGDLSQADWAVYQWMAAAQEPIKDPHLTLDSTCIPPEEVAERVRAYWLGREASERVGE
jgi:predicted kinase